jgi:hypothetical protein
MRTTSLSVSHSGRVPVGLRVSLDAFFDFKVIDLSEYLLCTAGAQSPYQSEVLVFLSVANHSFPCKNSRLGSIIPNGSGFFTSGQFGH